MILMTKNINLTNEELELIQGGADSYGKNPIGGGNHLCKGSAARF